MNNFESNFFKKYLTDGQEIHGIIHEHWIRIIGRVTFRLTSFVFIPVFLFFFSDALKILIPFYVFETFLILIFIKIIYDIFDWYNDVMIVTNEGVIDLDWSLFKTDMKNIKYGNIEGVQVDQNSVWDKILNKGTIVIHKIGDDVFELDDAIAPYDAVNRIENMSKRKARDKPEDRFETVIEALGGVVEDYMERKAMYAGRKIKSKKEVLEDKSYVEEISRENGAIDLR